MTPKKLFNIGIKLLGIGLIFLLLILILTGIPDEWKWESKEKIFREDVTIEAGYGKEFNFLWEPPADRLARDDKIFGTIKNISSGTFNVLLFSSEDIYTNWQFGGDFYPHLPSEPKDTLYGVTSCKFTVDENCIIFVENPNTYNITIRFTTKVKWIQEKDLALISNFLERVTAFLTLVIIPTAFLLIIIAPIWKYVSSNENNNSMESFGRVSFCAVPLLSSS